MSRFKLTHWQRRCLLGQLKTTPEALTYRRTLAVLELDRGRCAAEVAELLGVTRQSVYNWAAAFAREHDPNSLTDDPRSGRPRLLPEPTEWFLRSLMKQPPQELGYPDTDWTTPLLQQELERGTGLLSSDDTVRRALHRLGCVWKRPRYVLDPDPERDKKRRIRRQIQGLPRRSVVLAEDETDLLLFPPLRAGWSLRGEPAKVHISGRNARRVVFARLSQERIKT